MSESMDKLTAELVKFTATEQALSVAIQGVVAALQADATKITDLTNQLAIANNSSNDAAIEALLPQFDSIADKLNTDASVLQTAIPGAQT